MAPNFAIFELPHDPVLEEANQKTKRSKPFGEIAVGPKKVMLTKPYLNWADRISEMEIRKDDVWVISYPRSGTTWTEEMTWLLCNNLDYDTAKSEVLHKRFMYLELAAMREHKKIAEEFWPVDKVINAKSPRFIKTHLSVELLPKQLWTVKPKIIYVYRNPKDVVISLYYFVCMINGYEGTFEECAEIFIQDKCIYNPYWSHVLDFWELQKKQDNILFLTYEKMKEDLVSVVHEVAHHLGTHLTEEQAQKLADHLDYKNMKNNAAVNQGRQLTAFKIVDKPEDANFIRKGRSGEWKEKMTPQMIADFDDWSKKHIDGTDFCFYD